MLDKLRSLFYGRPALFHFAIGPVLEQKTAVVPSYKHHGRMQGVILMSLTMTDNQMTTVRPAGYTDKKGNPAILPSGAQFQWTVDNPNLLDIAPAPDGQSCLVKAVGPLGSGTLSLKVSDAGGNPIITGVITCTIVGGAPANVDLEPDSPVDQPAAALRQRRQ